MLGLGKAFQHCRKVRRIDFLRLAVTCGKLQNGPCNLILCLGRETRDRLECLLKKLSHDHIILLSVNCTKGRHYSPAFASAAAWRLPTRSIVKRSIASLNRR